MIEFNKKASVIIPVYNNEELISKTLDSIVSQTMEKESIEAIVIDSSSTDSSLDICTSYAREYSFFRVYSIPNEGTSRARNFALEQAKGKYIFYLDAEDTYSENVLEKVTDFFDNHYNDVDLVTFKTVPIKNGKRKDLHPRYQVLKDSGVYDLSADENTFISQCDINTAVKNTGDANVLFDATPNLKQEAMLYCTEILKNKMKLGYVDGCEYLSNGAAKIDSADFSPLSIFDIITDKWEALFKAYTEDLPKYIQALFINDILWKLNNDILLPYHLDNKGFEASLARIKKLLQRIDDEIILNFPVKELTNKIYFIKMKHGDKITFEHSDKLSLVVDKKVMFEADRITVNINKFKIHSNNKLEICGHLSSPVFDFSPMPQLYINLKGKLQEAELYESSFCYNSAKVKNNTAWGFRCVLDTKNDISLGFKVLLDNKELDTEINCSERVAFNKKINRTEYAIKNKKCTLTNNRFIIKNISDKEVLKFKIKEAFKYFPKNIKIFVVRLLNLVIPFGRVWLYHDCNTSKKDNGYYQFIHDFEIKDGVKRYYVVNGSIDKVKDMFTPEQQKYLVTFRSDRHKLLYLASEKVITAFIENVNYIPFFDDVYKYYMDLFNADVIYLQHGVLHAHLPWKYSYDRLDVTAEVISTHYEVENFTKNYCFPETALIKSKMPRYDFVDITENNNKRILFAPSWRKYLIKLAGDGSWIPTPDKFLNSDYYKRTMEFLNSEELHSLLEENDWYLDFKPHPIFSIYNDYFKTSSPRINIPESATVSDYKVLITDYSSFVFDFVYLERAIVYFLPDYREFKSGLNDYREVDIPFENGFGQFTQNKDEAIAALAAIIKNNGEAISPFNERNAGFFFNKEKNSRDKIYEAATGYFA